HPRQRRTRAARTAAGYLCRARPCPRATRSADSRARYRELPLRGAPTPWMSSVSLRAPLLALLRTRTLGWDGSKTGCDGRDALFWGPRRRGRARTVPRAGARTRRPWERLSDLLLRMRPGRRPAAWPP